MLALIIPVAGKILQVSSAVHSGQPQSVLLVENSIVSISGIEVRVKLFLEDFKETFGNLSG
jgi:hypothetical protein